MKSLLFTAFLFLSSQSFALQGGYFDNRELARIINVRFKLVDFVTTEENSLQLVTGIERQAPWEELSLSLPERGHQLVIALAIMVLKIE
ncbi:hypothetical protein [Bdellovibrio sp. HCB-162]|uniref:hypothetical protein n=1 Tax=Bdellovibrio sp. HCB-162 TaxID=3394234 RepID=UPI0039BCF57C